MSCRPGCPKQHDMSAVPDMSVISWLLFELKHKNSMIAKVPVRLGWFVLVGSNWYKLGVSGTLLCRNDTQCRPRFGDIDTCRRHGRHVELSRPSKTSTYKSKYKKPKTSSKKVQKPKLIRVLLDSGSDGDLLFHKKGAPKCFPYTTRQVPKSWCTSNGNFHMLGLSGRFHRPPNLSL